MRLRKKIKDIKLQDLPQPDDKTPPENPLFGKFDEMVDAALTHRPLERRIKFRKTKKPKEEDRD